MRKPILSALILLVCASCQSPSPTPDQVPTPTPAPTTTFRVVSTSLPSGGTLTLPTSWPQNARVLAPTVTIQFTHSQSIPNALVVVDLMIGSNVCLEAEGLQMGAGYATLGPYVGGSTITVTGNNFERNIGYALCGATTFTTDHLRFRLMATSAPSIPGGPLTVTTAAVEDVPLTWTFLK